MKIYNIDEQFEMIRENPYNLGNIENPHREVILEAVKRNGLVLQYVENQDEEICIEAVKNYGYALEYVKEQTEKIFMEATKQNPNAAIYINLENIDKKIIIFIDEYSREVAEFLEYKTDGFDKWVLPVSSLEEVSKIITNCYIIVNKNDLYGELLKKLSITNNSVIGVNPTGLKLEGKYQVLINKIITSYWELFDLKF
jgi:hypothetical protein